MSGIDRDLILETRHVAKHLPGTALGSWNLGSLRDKFEDTIAMGFILQRRSAIESVKMVIKFPCTTLR
jgi:hypothetical protein